MQTLKYDVAPVGVSCSCGRSTVLDFDGTRYASRDPRWRFRKVSEAEEFERVNGRYIACGWYCGEEGHEQAGSL